MALHEGSRRIVRVEGFRSGHGDGWVDEELARGARELAEAEGVRGTEGVSGTEGIESSLVEGVEASHCGLWRMPMCLTSWTLVQRMYLQWNALVELPAELSRLTGLEELWLAHNRIADLPPEIAALTRIRVLDLRSNRLEHIPSAAARLPLLAGLDLGANRITSLPDYLSQQGSQESRDGAKRDAFFPSLRVLDLRANSITDLPSDLLAGLPHSLRTLALDGNPLPQGWLHMLTGAASYAWHTGALQLAHLGLTALPMVVTSLPRLEAVHLAGNALSSLPPLSSSLEVGAAIKLVDVSANRLTHVPAAILALGALQSLDLSYNSLSRLPAAISNLTALSKLCVEHNVLSDLPSEIAALTKMHTLTLSHNKIAALPPTITCLTALQSLDLIGNQFTPMQITLFSLYDFSRHFLSLCDMQLDSLDFRPDLDHDRSSGSAANHQSSHHPAFIPISYLNLAGNHLSSLTASWTHTELSTLTALDITRNPFLRLPDSIASAFPKLSLLIVDNTPISHLPASLASLVHLETFSAKGCPIDTIDIKIADSPSLRRLALSHQIGVSAILAVASILRINHTCQVEFDGQISSSTPPPLWSLIQMQNKFNSTWSTILQETFVFDEEYARAILLCGKASLLQMVPQTISSKIPSFVIESKSAVSLAVYYSHTKLVEILLEMGLPVSTRDDSGRNALDYVEDSIDPAQATIIHDLVIRAMEQEKSFAGYFIERTWKQADLLVMDGYAKESGNHVNICLYPSLKKGLYDNLVSKLCEVKSVVEAIRSKTTIELTSPIATLVEFFDVPEDLHQADQLLPFCIVTEAGEETVDSYLNRTHHRMSDSELQHVLMHLCQSLALLHDPFGAISKRPSKSVTYPGFVVGNVQPKTIIRFFDGSYRLSVGSSISKFEYTGNPLLGEWTIIPSTVSFSLSEYSAPELFDTLAEDCESLEEQYMTMHPSMDVWSLGAVIFELATGSSLLNIDSRTKLKCDQSQLQLHYREALKNFKDQEELNEFIIAKVKKTALSNLLITMLQLDPLTRWTAVQIMNHQYFANIIKRPAWSYLIDREADHIISVEKQMKRQLGSISDFASMGIAARRNLSLIDRKEMPYVFCILPKNFDELNLEPTKFIKDFFSFSFGLYALCDGGVRQTVEEQMQEFPYHFADAHKTGCFEAKDLRANFPLYAMHFQQTLQYLYHVLVSSGAGAVLKLNIPSPVFFEKAQGIDLIRLMLQATTHWTDQLHSDNDFKDWKEGSIYLQEYLDTFEWKGLFLESPQHHNFVCGRCYERDLKIVESEQESRQLIEQKSHLEEMNQEKDRMLLSKEEEKKSLRQKIEEAETKLKKLQYEHDSTLSNIILLQQQLQEMKIYRSYIKHPQPIFEGTMLKKSRKWVGWKDRFLRLTPMNLEYAVDREGAKGWKYLPLIYLKVEKTSPRDGILGLTSTSSGRPVVLEFRARSAAECEEWYQQITTSIQKLNA
eukprot:TRINITY_DN628_c0_g1_i8.p1 TRINITY_DN628_c0_g1~~TRINITY_DN628_c0_g1_i8.p1  ORF type:complete len:1494 (-),score=302.97 TRINITY_DN628_c0_g1_i8:241-4626(-)